VYTWHDDYVDNKKIFKFHYPQVSLTVIDDIVPFEQKRFSVFITSSVDRMHPLSLTAERRNTIQFFERHESNDFFHLYGKGWEKYRLKNYKRRVKKKVNCMKHYKFAFCYENTRDFNGYVTEKAFDAMVAGCIPIYLGVPNATEFIPQNCFINRRDFEGHEDLLQFLRAMSKDDYQTYLDNIQKYLQSSRAFLFSPEMFIDTMLKAVDPHYDKSIALTADQRALFKKHNK